MEKNKTGKYLKYAIGEIILVVIGILIALQINNWNEKNKNAKEELKLLQEMHYNLKNDLKDCLWNMNKQSELSLSNKAVLRHLENRTPLNEVLQTHYGNLIYSTTQRRNMSTYEHLKSKGIDLISNDSLRRHITAIYSERYYFIEKMELEYDNQYQLNTVVPEINAKVVIEDTLQIGRPVTLESLYDDNTFKGMLRMHIKIRAQMRSRYDGLRKNLEDLIDHITAELNERL